MDIITTSQFNQVLLQKLCETNETNKTNKTNETSLREDLLKKNKRRFSKNEIK